MGIKGFSKDVEVSLTTTEIVDDTLEVQSNGNVTFRTRRGKGSGREVEIEAEQFDTFVSQMNDIAGRREGLADKARMNEHTDEDSNADSE